MRTLLFLSLFAASTALAAEPEAKPKAEPEHPRMETISMVILVRGDKWTPEVTPQTQEIQKQHIGHLKKMGEAGKLVVAGPLSDQPDPSWRGIALYKTGLEEARKLAEEDPAVKAGRLKVLVMTWFTEKGAMAFPLADATAKKAP